MDKFEAWKLEFGTKVIVRSNEKEPFKIGELVGFHSFNDTDSSPLIRINGQELICMGVVIPYSDEMNDLLTFLPYQRQWELLRDLSIAIQIMKRERIRKVR